MDPPEYAPVPPIDPDNLPVGSFVMLYEAPGEGIFVWLCEFCGQPLPGPAEECHSGLHVGPNVGHVGRAIRSIDLARRNG